MQRVRDVAFKDRSVGHASYNSRSVLCSVMRLA